MQGQPNGDPSVLYNANCQYEINYLCGQFAAIRCSSHTNRNTLGYKNATKNDGCGNFGINTRGGPDISNVSNDHNPSIIDDSHHLWYNKNVKCGGVQDVYPGTS